MKTPIYSKLTLCLTLSLACVVDDDGTGGGEGDTGDTSASTTVTTSTTGTSATTAGTDSADTGATDTVDGTASDTVGTESGSTGPDPTIFEFMDGTYAAVDRKGAPAVNTALIASANKDTYNVSTPVDDVAGDFEDDIDESIETLHVGAAGMVTPMNTGLNDDLAGLMLTPCVATGFVNECALQVTPFIIPDTLVLDTDVAAGFPNGRLLDDQVIDVVLAVLLLDLTVMGQTPFLFADLPLNPPANDANTGMFSAEFPYLLPPN
jgi:hypothetical protein